MGDKKEGFEINRAARMMRAGNEFSETNRKLREAVWSSIEWLWVKIGPFVIPESLGWRINSSGQEKIQLNFCIGDPKQGHWHSVVTNWEGSDSMNETVLYCRALAGPEGERLISWLETQLKERKDLLQVLQNTRGDFLTMLRQAVPASQKPSEWFEDAVRHTGSNRVECQLCGRTHFASGDGHYEKGELEHLIKMAEEKPDEFIDHGDDSIHWGDIDGKQTVIGCPCNGLYPFEKWIWEHRFIIERYFKARSAAELERAKAQADALGSIPTPS